jgi:hypothetical protein
MKGSLDYIREPNHIPLLTDHDVGLLTCLANPSAAAIMGCFCKATCVPLVAYAMRGN